MAPKRKNPARGEDVLPVVKKVKHIVPELKWDDDITSGMLTYILNDKFVRTKLFPAPGQNPSSAEGGGKPKTHAYWTIARNYFGEMPEYADAIDMLIKHDDAEARGAWGKKVKNHLDKIVKKVNKARDSMQQTGAGLEDDDEDGNNNKWESIYADIPYYDDVAILIGQRPNQVLAGVGNSADAVDDTVFGLDNTTRSVNMATDLTVEHKMKQPSLDDTFSSDSEDEVVEKAPASKGKGKIGAKTSSDGTPAAVKSEATASKTVSTPAGKKPTTAELRFNDLAMKEEGTKQAMLDVRRKRIEEEQATRRDRLKLALLREEHKAARRRERHEERMAELALRRIAYQRDHSVITTRPSWDQVSALDAHYPVASGSGVTLDSGDLGSFGGFEGVDMYGHLDPSLYASVEESLAGSSTY